MTTKKLTADEYLEWLNTFLIALNDFTALAEDKNTSADYKATMVSFLRVAEHVFNYFITQRISYGHPNSSQLTYDEIKRGRNKVADRIINIIESDPEISKRFKKFCDNLKEPRMYGFSL